MSTRKPRRAVMAELLLMADPADVRTRDDVSLAIRFDRIAELRSWLRLTGLDTPDLLTGEHTGTSNDGRSFQTMNAYPTWHGWEIYAHAIEFATAPDLDPGTVEQLTALAVA